MVGVYTAADLEGDIAGPLPFVWPITEDIKIPVHWPLTKDKARFAGDGVAVVLAETREQAKDAAEAVQVDYEALPVVLDLEEAGADGAPVLHEELGGNTVVHWSHGGAGDQSIFDSAPVVVKERYVQPRLIPNAIEPRGCLAMPVPGAGRVHAVDGHADPAHREGDALRRGRHPGVEAADHRAGRGRRLRLEAEHLRGGGA